MSDDVQDNPPVPTMTDSHKPQQKPGEQLRAARETRGFTEAQAAKELYLSLRLVQAIEADAYKDLPEPIYVRGYMRRYAQWMQLPPDAIVAAFDRSYAADHETPVLDAPLAHPVQELGVMHPSKFSMKWLWLLLGLLVVLAVIGGVLSRYSQPVTAELPQAADVNVDAAPASPLPLAEPVQTGSALPAASPVSPPAVLPSRSAPASTITATGTATTAPAAPAVIEPQSPSMLPAPSAPSAQPAEAVTSDTTTGTRP